MIIHRHHLSEAGDEPAELITPAVATPLEAMAEIYLALVMGLRDYCHKNGIERVYLGLSGGIDSTLVATLACDAWALIMSMASPIPAPTPPSTPRATPLILPSGPACTSRRCRSPWPLMHFTRCLISTVSRLKTSRPGFGP